LGAAIFGWGNDLKVFAGQSNPELAIGICQALGLDPGLILDQSGLEGVAITDTIPLPTGEVNPKVQVCSVASLFANAIRAIHEETSISALFN